MTRDEHRAKCIEAMQQAATRYGIYIDWFAAFDSLHGIALIFPEVSGDVAEYCFTREQTLTNPPEGKP